MNLAQLRYFTVLAETEHYRKASERLFISQPALSNSITSLECELGTPLFERKGRNIQLTDAGLHFYHVAQSALTTLDRGIEDIKEYRLERDGFIRIGTVESIQRNELPKLLSSFKAHTHKSIMFNVIRCNTYEAIHKLREGSIDIAFCGRLPSLPDVTFIPFLTQETVVTLNKASKLAQKESVSLEDLKEYRLASYRDHSYMYAVYKRVLKHFGLAFTQSFDDEISASTMVSIDQDVVAINLETTDDISFTYATLRKIKELPGPFHLVACAYLNQTHNDIINEFANYVEQYSNLKEPLSLL